MAEVDYRQLSDTSLVMPNGQSLNVQRFTVNNQPWVLYPGKTPADGDIPLYVGTDGTNYQFYTYGAEDGYRLYPYHPVQGSPEDEKNLSKSQEVYTRAYGNDKNKKQFGGTMNYTSYLQGGGSMVQALIEKVIQSQGQDRSALWQLVQLAEEGNEEAVAFLQELQGQSPAMKCGGRVKKKQLGEKIMKAKKASCGCQLKKVGGRLIEVDSCTGLPVHRNGGMVKKYQNAAGGIKRADNGTYYFEDGPSSRTYTAAEAKERLGAVRYDGNYYYRDPSGKIYTQKSTPLNWAQSAGWSEVDRNERGAYQLPSQVLTDLGYQKRANGSWGYGAAPAAPAQPAQTAPSAPEQTAQPVSPVQPAPTQQPAAPSTPGLFTGDLRSYGARKQWVSDNAEYLKSQGWDDARIAGYRGSAADNIELQKAISGKAAWDQEQAQNAEFARQRELDRQKQLAFENEMANSRSVDATGYRSKPVRTQPLTMQERYSQLTPWEREQITFSNDQLKSMNPAQALYLPKMQYDQYLNLKFNR